ncbi:hypothetical protein RSOL_282890, partial [Rhizoctonia solani AG-3 Rhs1AP]
MSRLHSAGFVCCLHFQIYKGMDAPEAFGDPLQLGINYLGQRRAPLLEHKLKYTIQVFRNRFLFIQLILKPWIFE